MLDFPAVFFKVYFYERGFQFEVEGLTAANVMPPVPGIRVPAVVTIFPDKKAIMTELRSWQDTTSPFRSFFVQSLKMDWGRIGTWLRQFHDSRTSLQRNDYFLSKKFEKICRPHAVLAALHGISCRRWRASSGTPASTTTHNPRMGHLPR